MANAPGAVIRGGKRRATRAALRRALRRPRAPRRPALLRRRIAIRGVALRPWGMAPLRAPDRRPSERRSTGAPSARLGFCASGRMRACGRRRPDWATRSRRERPPGPPRQVAMARVARPWAALRGAGSGRRRRREGGARRRGSSRLRWLPLRRPLAASTRRESTGPCRGPTPDDASEIARTDADTRAPPLQPSRASPERAVGRGRGSRSDQGALNRRVRA